MNKLGKSSVDYEVGVFERGLDDVKAVGGFTHVFVERVGNRPPAAGMAQQIRKGLEMLLVKDMRSKL